MTNETIHARASRIVQNEVHCCMSSIVSTLAQGYGSFHNGAAAYEPGNRAASDIENLTERAFELAMPIPDFEEAAREAGWKPYGGLETGHWWRDGEAGPGGTVDMLGATSAQDACEQDGLEPYEREVFEHWAVSDWLADKLIAHGEKVDKDFAGLCVWARATTGQAISIDHVVEQIAAELGA